jgi:uncharacterized OsmC-like protein
VTLKPGLECELTEGPWKMTIAMGQKSGGTGAGPNPGTLGRGALGTCLALGYAMWAARLGVPLEALSVDIEADYDSRGELGLSDEIPPGYTQVRYTVNVTSPASQADVERVIDTADKYSPYRDVFMRAHDVQRTLTIHAGTSRVSAT